MVAERADRSEPRLPLAATLSPHSMSVFDHSAVGWPEGSVLTGISSRGQPGFVVSGSNALDESGDRPSQSFVVLK